MIALRPVLIGLVLLLGLASAVLVDLITAAAASDPEPDGDVALVLGAAVWGDRPSPVFQARIDHAIGLYRDGHVRQLVFSGGSRSDSVASESLVAQRYATHLGVPGEDIRLEGRSRTTTQNLACSLPLVRDTERVVLVSDPLHLWRARWIAKDLGLEVELAPAPGTRYRSRSARARFLVREVGLSVAYAAERLGGSPTCRAPTAGAG